MSQVYMSDILYEATEKMDLGGQRRLMDAASLLYRSRLPSREALLKATEDALHRVIGSIVLVEVLHRFDPDNTRLPRPLVDEERPLYDTVHTETWAVEIEEIADVAIDLVVRAIDDLCEKLAGSR